MWWKTLSLIFYCFQLLIVSVRLYYVLFFKRRILLPVITGIIGYNDNLLRITYVCIWNHTFTYIIIGPNGIICSEHAWILFILKHTYYFTSVWKVSNYTCLWLIFFSKKSPLTWKIIPYETNNMWLVLKTKNILFCKGVISSRKTLWIHDRSMKCLVFRNFILYKLK